MAIRRSTKAGSQTRQRRCHRRSTPLSSHPLNEGRVSDPATSRTPPPPHGTSDSAQRRPGLRPGNVVDDVPVSVAVGVRSTKAGSQTRQRPAIPRPERTTRDNHAQRRPGLRPGNVTPSQPPRSGRASPLNEGRVSDPATSWNDSVPPIVREVAQRRPGLRPGNVVKSEHPRAPFRRRSTKAGSQTRQRRRRCRPGGSPTRTLNEGRVSDPATSMSASVPAVVSGSAQRRPGLRPGNVHAANACCRGSRSSLNEGRVSDPATSLFPTVRGQNPRTLPL